MENSEVKTPSELAEEARRTGRDAAELAADSAATGSAYAKEAADSAIASARTKARDLKAQWDQAGESCARYIAEEPMKSVLFSAAGGALLTTLVVAALRGGRRY